MFADGTEFARHPPTGPGHFKPVFGAAFGAHAFGRFFAEANGLDAFDTLLRDEYFFFCWHASASVKLGKKGLKRDLNPPVRRLGTRMCNVAALFLSIPNGLPTDRLP